MSVRRRRPLAVVVLTVAVTILCAGVAQAQLTPKEELGKELFFDEQLSTPPGQSCATCHDPASGFTGPDSQINATQSVYPGVVHTRSGNRKPPTAAYGGGSPVLFYDATDEVWVGGMFWDGRATGDALGDPLADQAQGPFLNPLEQNNPNPKLVCIKVSQSDYADLFEEVWGPISLDRLGVAAMYDQIALSIAEYERSAEVNPFNSKYDQYLAGEPVLTPSEASGLALFEGKAMCSACHPSELGPGGEKPLFTDFTYDNLGVPKNPDNPFYDMPRKWNPDGADWVDPGLGGFLASAGEDDAMVAANWGKYKVPTLRNVDLRPSVVFVKAYGHNGYFKSLEEIVHFYNTRDVPGAGWEGEPWPSAEVADNVNTDELGDLQLTEEEEADIVAFLRTLSDEPPGP